MTAMVLAEAQRTQSFFITVLHYYWFSPRPQRLCERRLCNQLFTEPIR
jgi:hypothetical protein